MDNENGVISAFVDNLNNLAAKCGAIFKHYPTGGADRKLLGDAVFTNSVNYSLVEFKDSLSKNKSEKKKNLRVYPVCESLYENSRMRELHNKCHFFAGDDVDGAQTFYIYRDAVCNTQVLQGFFGERLKCLYTKCDPSKEIELYDYAVDLFSGGSLYALPAKEFDEYLNMLVSVTTKGKKGSEICLIAARRDEKNKCFSIRFDSVGELHEWFQKEVLRITKNNSPGSGQTDASGSKPKSNPLKPSKSGGSGGWDGPS
ncbi:hypothetical protein [Pseudomonas fluorescens]|uniref:hypothetical protein n=1 Tax=Pseudomonas fluorescens TaxID=294 RepID=UPI0011CE6F51|nr:hypothetical protein [Pseudomonas fluorescens]